MTKGGVGMLVDCPCGEMYDSREGSCKCGRKARLSDTDEAHDHYPDEAYEEEEEEEDE